MNISLTQPFYVTLILQQFSSDQDHLKREPLIFDWSHMLSFNWSQFKLFHHSQDGLREIDVPQVPGLFKDDDECTIGPSWANNGVHEFKPGKTEMCNVWLSEPYYKAMVVEEKYTLLWPGKRVSKRAWGSVSDHMKKKLEVRHPPITILGGSRVTFTAKPEDELWRQRKEKEVEEKYGLRTANQQESVWRANRKLKTPPPFEESERM